MSKHYFKTTAGFYGVALSARGTLDIDVLVYNIPDINSIHKTKGIDITDCFSRVWSGIVQYGRDNLTYIIAESLEQISDMSVFVLGNSDRESLEYRTNKILEIFGLEEVSSKRNYFREVIKSFIEPI